MCQRGLCAHVPKTFQRLIFTCQRVNKCANVSTCHRRAIYSTWRANVPKAWQYFNIACQRVKKGANFSTSPAKKAYQFFNFFVFQFLNFSIMLNIGKFLEYLGNSRKIISRNKEFKFWHLQNFIKEKLYQPKTYNSVFSGTRGINRTIIRPV